MLTKGIALRNCNQTNPIMKNLKTLFFFLAMLVATTASAQRHIDKLDRGLVGVKTTKGVFLSWRIQSEEYYNVTYNLYRDGVKVAENLSTSNFTDAGGSTSASYQVAAVVRGVEKERCEAVKPWANDYLDITLKHDPSLKATYIPNDACCADVDGDGQVEILLKLTNKEEAEQSFPKNGPTIDGVETKEYTLLEVWKLDGTLLWWVNCGPNMGDFQNNEQNIVGYDWDLDGKAEVVIRLCEGAEVHMADGTIYIIGKDGKNGTSWTNYRTPKTGGTEWFTYYGNEFLWYCEGATGQLYQCISYPCARFESGESNLSSAWGDGYGHRASKFFFGAPYLDGHKPSIFLGRGIYTRHKFVALDVDPATHKLTERWRWMNNSPGPWYGQGYHNYAIADVDMDGRDEIIWGSMVIDDNGKGLSTTGLGHGDAQHHGDLDPYSYGLEGFFCNESQPANNYRDLTTSKFYHRYAASGDDGRAIAGNFCGTVPGAMGFSAHENPVSCVTGNVESALVKDGVGMNFRCYWDGDLLEETYNGGDNTVGSITKYGSWTAIKELTGSLTNNSTKATPSYMGDILGDWREEFVVRTPDNNLRIFTTTIQTPWRMQSLWYDHQYRNGMVWEPCGYNQPPHASFFVGELEGYTAAPPSLTMTGRTEVGNGGTISADGTDIIACETNDMTIAVKDGVAPTTFIDNAPSWVQGSAPSEATASSYTIKYNYYTHTLTGGAFTGSMNLVKQGAGTLVMPNATHTYTGNTDVWEGTLVFDGKLPESRVFLNRHTSLCADGAVFGKAVEAYYNAVLRPGGKESKAGSITADSLILRYGAVAELDIYSEGLAADKLNANVLVVEKKNWAIGPKYQAPVFRLVAHIAEGASAIADGVYELGEVGEVKGDLSDIVIEGMTMQKTKLSHENGKLLLTVQNFEAEPVTWTGEQSANWNVDEDKNFKLNSTGEACTFYNGSEVTFNDEATAFTINITEDVAPSAVIFNNVNKAFIFDGNSIQGTPEISKTGKGMVKLNNTNNVGNTIIEEGSIYVAELANSVGCDMGSLGTIGKSITLKNEGMLGITKSLTGSQRIVCSTGNGRIDVGSGMTFTQTGAIATANSGELTKTGAGTLSMSGSMTPAKLTVASGSLNYTGASYTKSTTLKGTASISGSGFLATPLTVETGAKASYTTVNRATSSNNLTGGGQITIYCSAEKGSTYYATRTPLQLKMASFEGTIVAEAVYSADGRFTFDTSSGSDKWTLQVPANRFVQNSGKTLRIGQVTGSGTLGGTCTFSSSSNSAVNTWNVGNDGDFTFDGQVVDNAKFTKMGTGKMTVGNSWTTTGAVTVSEGELHSNAGKTLGTGALTVAANATYSCISAATSSSAKNNPVTNSSITVSGKLQVGSGSTSTTGFLNLGDKGLTLKSTSTYRVGINKCATATAPGCTNLFGDGEKAALTIEDGVTIEAFLSPNYNPSSSVGTDEQKADSFRIFNALANVKIGKVNFALPELPSGYYWDTDKFNEGYLFVRFSATGIHGLKATETVAVEVVNVNGTVVGRFSAKVADIKQTFASKPYSNGVYVLRMRNSKGKNASVRVAK